MWFVIGAVAGSVASAVVYRLPRGLSWWRGRSVCSQCKHALAWFDLIPLLSYLQLQGKCRYCHKAIGIRYFLVELVMAVGFAYFQSPLLAALLFITVIISFMDLETMLVSDWMVGAWFILVVLSTQYSVLSFYGLLAGIGVIGGIWALSRGRAMGFGDVEIIAVLGMWLGWPKIGVAMWWAFVIGAVVGVIKLWRGKAKLKSQIAFGPFLILGGWIVSLFF